MKLKLIKKQQKQRQQKMWIGNGIILNKQLKKWAKYFQIAYLIRASSQNIQGIQE